MDLTDTYPLELRAQVAYLSEARAFTGPDGLDQFVALGPFERRQIIRSVVEDRCREMAETSPVPWVSGVGDLSYEELIEFAEVLADQQPEAADGVALLREAGCPLVEAEEPTPLPEAGAGTLQALAEAGVPLRGREPQRRQLTPDAHLADLGIPLVEPETISIEHHGISEAAALVTALHEAASGSSSGPLDRGDRELMAEDDQCPTCGGSGVSDDCEPCDRCGGDGFVDPGDGVPSGSPVTSEHPVGGRQTLSSATNQQRPPGTSNSPTTLNKTGGGTAGLAEAGVPLRAD